VSTFRGLPKSSIFVDSGPRVFLQNSCFEDFSFRMFRVLYFYLLLRSLQYDGALEGSSSVSAANVSIFVLATSERIVRTEGSYGHGVILYWGNDG
jgi:hypothetical protein